MTDERATVTPDQPIADPAIELLRWRYHPVREGGPRLVAVIAFLIGVPVILGALYGPFFVILSLVILGGSLGTYFLPTVYVLYSGGLETHFIGVTRRFAWDQFRSFYPDRNGVLLSPFAAPSRLENFRGLFVRFSGNRDAVLAIVRERVPLPLKEETKTP
jgi:hypothetical protein